MNLGFSTHIDGKQTQFIQKIWLGFDWKNTIIIRLQILHYALMYKKKFGEMWDYKNLKHIKPKIHTIREDSKNRWKVGQKIHFVINNRTKNRFQFAPVIPVTSIQKIEIQYLPEMKINFPKITIDEDGKNKVLLNPFNHFEYITQLNELARNDGFDSWEEFLNYFDKDFQGKIIHWTDFKY